MKELKYKKIFEDDDCLVINKPAGILVHGAPHINEPSLADQLLKDYPEIAKVGEDPDRPGIVHRLDKFVSGLMVIAKTQDSFEKAYELDRMYNEAGPILALARFWAVLPWPLRDRKKSLKLYREYQATPYFSDNIEGQTFFAELLLQLGGKENITEARGYLQNAQKSDESYLRNRAPRLLGENK